jgi:hypothetical protein
MKSLIYQNLKHIVTYICTQFKLTKHEKHTNGRPLALQDEDALTFALYQHRSTRATKKSVFDDFKQSLQCSYQTFVRRVNMVGILALRILFILMRVGRKDAHLVKFTDATDLPVCLAKNAKRHKTMRGLAAWGHSGKGFYYGLKLTITRDDDGRLLNIQFSKGNGNDRNIFRKINKDIDGIIVADAGYCSKELERDMYQEGKRWCLIKPYKSMKRLATA